MGRIKKQSPVKVVFAGETNVGKTSIVERIIFDRLSNNISTVGAAFSVKKMFYEDKEVILGLWDTAGQERYRSMSSIYFRHAIICILVFDLSRRDSLNKILIWKELCADANEGYYENHTNIPIFILVGNKSDVKNRAITNEEISSFCQNNNIIHYFETSAFTGDGIKILFNKVTELACTIKIPSIAKVIPTFELETNNNCQC